MKTINILILALLCNCGVFIHETYADNPPVIIVNDRTDEVQHVPWKKGMKFYTLLYVLRNQQDPSTNRAFIISHGKIQKLSKLTTTDMDNIVITPGDIVIFGGLYPARIVKIRADSEVDAGFKSLSAGSLPSNIMP